MRGTFTGPSGTRIDIGTIVLMSTMLTTNDTTTSGATQVAPSPLPHSVIESGSSRDLFFQTAYERMAIYHRRFVLKQPAPWTTDETFRVFSFTNVHRELDRGTIEYIQNLLAPLTASGASDGDVLAATITYRWFNRVETFRQSLAAPMLSGRFDAIEIEDNVRSQVGPPFTAAHMVCAYDGKPGRDKLERVCIMLAEIYEQRDTIAAKLKTARRPDDAFQTLTALEGIGPFNGYEIYSDLLYADDRFFSWNEDAWANVGPGAHRGLKLIFPNESPCMHLDSLRKLRNDQEATFDRLGLDFYAISPNGKRMTMRSCEHWACEFQKFVRGNTKRRFVPQTIVAD